MKKIGAVHLIKSYSGEGRKYLEVLRIKYLVLPKYRTKYQKVRLDTNLIYNLFSLLFIHFARSSSAYRFSKLVKH